MFSAKSQLFAARRDDLDVGTRAPHEFDDLANRVRHMFAVVHYDERLLIGQLIDDALGAASPLTLRCGETSENR